MSADGSRTIGIVLVLAATFLWSTAGWFVRRLDLDIWTVLGWRAMFGALGLFLIVVLQHRGGVYRALRTLGPLGLLAIPASTVSMVAYVAALVLTDVANVMAMYATIPFVAAAIAYVWLDERPSRRVLVASTLCFAAIALMAAFPTGPDDLAGNACALLMTVSFAFVLVLVRRAPQVPIATVNMLAAAATFLLALPMMPAGWPTPGQFAVLAGFGVATTALAYVLFLEGGRRIPSAEAGLIALLDVVLGPLWVYLAFAEAPTYPAMLASIVVLGATAWYLSGLRTPRPAVEGRPSGSDT